MGTQKSTVEDVCVLIRKLNIHLENLAADGILCTLEIETDFFDEDIEGPADMLETYTKIRAKFVKPLGEV